MRTDQQNRAIHKYCATLAVVLNDHKLDARTVLDAGVSLPWTESMVKTYIWKPVADVINRQTQANNEEVHSHVAALMQRKFGIRLPYTGSIGSYCAALSAMLNERGLDMEATLKPGRKIWWSQELVKNQLWRPVQKTMLEKYSTTQLGKLDVSAVYDVINRKLLEQYGVYVEFPSKEAA